MIRRLTALAFLAAAAVIATAAGPADIWRRKPAGLVAGFDFSGGRLTSPTGFAGTLSGNATIATGSRYLSLDGVGDYMSVADDARLDFSGDCTVAVWFRRNGLPSTSNILAAKFNGASNTGWILYLTPGTGQARFDGGVGAGYRTGPGTPGNVCDNAWRHIAAVRSGSTWLLYLNGSLAASQVVASGSFANSNPLGVGGYDAYPPWGFFHTGPIAGLLLYERALAQPEIAQLYNSGAARIANGGTP